MLFPFEVAILLHAEAETRVEAMAKAEDIIKRLGLPEADIVSITLYSEEEE